MRTLRDNQPAELDTPAAPVAESQAVLAEYYDELDSMYDNAPEQVIVFHAYPEPLCKACDLPIRTRGARFCDAACDDPEFKDDPWHKLAHDYPDPWEQTTRNYNGDPLPE